MTSRRNFLTAGTAGLAAVSCPWLSSANAQTEHPPQIGVPPPRLVAREARIPVQLESVDIRVDVAGHAVRQRIELVFRNPNTTVLEGELQFPLADGQTVTGFALDINGELRRAVPVEKALGQQVFEDVIRARVDPALLEATEGNNYKLRVYPLPPQGTRRVVLYVGQALARRGGNGARLDVPLSYGERVAHVGVEVRVAGIAASAITIGGRNVDPSAVVREQTPEGAHIRLRLADDQRDAAAALTLALPDRAEPLVLTQRCNGRTYFYAEVPVRAWAAPRPAPQTVAVLWDASGSGARREHARELAVLDVYFKALRNIDVQLVIGRDAAESPRRFSVRDGRWDDLRRALSAMVYDGATNLAALRAPADCDLALLFSDGLSNWGGTVAVASTPPLYALSAVRGVDAQRLRAVAHASGGEWLDLLALSAPGAARALQTRKARLLDMSSHTAEHLVSASPYAEGERVCMAGVLLASDATVELQFGMPGGQIRRQHVRVAPHAEVATKADADESIAFAAQRWAALRVSELEADYAQHRAEIRRVGKAFGLPTRETSLIVLDAIADYVRCEIEPPRSLRAEYDRLRAQQRVAQRKHQADHLNAVAARFAAKVAWWEKSFPKGDQPAVSRSRSDALNGALEVRRAAPHSAPAAPAAASSAPLRQLAESAVTDQARAKKENAGSTAAQQTIHLTKWEPDSPYARRLRAASPETVYQHYLDERPDFANSTAFFLDAADVMFDKGLPELGLRVLSNLAEMELENRHILRVLAYRLLQAKQPALAIPLLETVLRLSPNEPQSQRDLGLAHAEVEHWQQAVDHLWEVVARAWDGRFPDVDLTALAELNAIAARAALRGTPVQTQAFDGRLMRNLPLDLRVVLAWDADNTDIDLWVIDPNGEKAFYGHQLTYQGGRMSRDFTGGYGPEEFALRSAKPGKYIVQAQFYGHRQQVVAPATTLMLRLATGFGTPAQKEEMITLRLSGRNDLITVGTFEV
jgi:hypothetical protein